MSKNIKVNQVGYLPTFEKTAMLSHASTTPLSWEIKDNVNKTVKAGISTVFGNDISSGDHVHRIDFSDFATEGNGYYITIGNEISPSFDIRKSIYSEMKYDALRYFYHNRAGIEISEKFAGSKELSRPAGHLGTVAIPVFGYDEIGDYKIIEDKGWYDAGDHGKYVVNGGITVWTLLNQFERAKTVGNVDAFGDNTIKIPESGNGSPDLLDEIKWEMDFLISMQIPVGLPKEGMAFHKLQDNAWTGSGMFPSDDKEQRIFMPPSTAATLNLAATAAQASRIWKDYDPTYSKLCLEVAEKAWKAALKHPDLFAPSPLDKRPDPTAGGGAYDDKFVEDEFYWAAAELYITTSEDEYYQFIKKSPFFLKLPSLLENGEEGPFSWGSVSGLGNVSLAIAPNNLPKSELEQIRTEIVGKADQWLKVMANSGYKLPIESFPWGSNSFILNRLIIFCYAYEFTNDKKYLNAVSSGMDYILGRNALSQSYVTGYGENCFKNPHHRFWAHQIDPKWPQAPAGAVSGGPNKAMQDPDVRSILPLDTPPQKCYYDHIASWSTNEIAINWNSPFAFVTAYLDEKASN